MTAAPDRSTKTVARHCLRTRAVPRREDISIPRSTTTAKTSATILYRPLRRRLLLERPTRTDPMLLKGSQQIVIFCKDASPSEIERYVWVCLGGTLLPAVQISRQIFLELSPIIIIPLICIHYIYIAIPPLPLC